MSTTAVISDVRTENDIKYFNATIDGKLVLVDVSIRSDGTPGYGEAKLFGTESGGKIGNPLAIQSLYPDWATAIAVAVTAAGL